MSIQPAVDVPESVWDAALAVATINTTRDAAQDKFLSIFEMAEEHAPGGEITDEEAREVDAKLAKATVTISWPEGTWTS